MVAGLLITTLGAPGGALIVIFDDGSDEHPAALVTVKVYIPGASPDKVCEVPLPCNVIPSLRVSVQRPVAGNPPKTTLPVGTDKEG
jgi:hypothetical protein